MDVAVAKMAEARGVGAGKGRLDRCRRRSARKRGMASTGTEMSCWVAGPKAARSASDRLSRMRHIASACASLDAIAASATSPRSISGASKAASSRRRLVVAAIERRLDQRVPRMIGRQAARGCPGIWPSAAPSDSRGRISKPSMRSVAASSARRTSSAAGGTGEAEPGDAREAIAGTSFRRAAVTMPSVPFGPDQQLVEAIAAIVLLEPGQAVMDRSVGQHRLDPLDQRAHRAEAQHLRAPGVGRDQPADRRAALRAQRQRKARSRSAAAS